MKVRGFVGRMGRAGEKGGGEGEVKWPQLCDVTL